MNFSIKVFERSFKSAALVLLLMVNMPLLAIRNPGLVARVDPPFWWVGMKERSLELLFYGEDFSGYEVSLDSPQNVSIVKVSRPANPGYMIVEISIGEDQPAGILDFVFTPARGKATRYKYELKRRNPAVARGIDPSDLVYLVFPDRFSNGDERNDAFPDMNEKLSDRKGLKARHGGDIQGIINHIDYISDLGATAVWINPVLENNQHYESYHGYAFTDHYKVDRRLGNNDLFRALSDTLHAKGLALVWDVVYNHCGSQHPLFTDLPDSSWFHWFPEYTKTNYRAETLMDPYASQYDRNIMSDGWFDRHMPDINQQDPHMARYLIQNSIWWIEYARLDAFRIDTYAYPDQHFMKALNEAVLKEYPDFFLFGETWVQGSPIQAWFTEGDDLNPSFSSSLHGVTDFQLYYAIHKGLTENFGWEEGFRRIEMTLAHDILYKDPYRNVTHLDNHDLSRFFSMVKEDYARWKMGIALLYTLRGTPSIYYGTEILMKNYSDPDAKVREDFPGGWRTDSINKFVAAGRTQLENEAFGFCSRLGQWRKQNGWFGRSQMTQFVPENNTYIYFRHDTQHTLMCLYNASEAQTVIDLRRFRECILDSKTGTDILSGEKFVLETEFILQPKSVMLLELSR